MGLILLVAVTVVVFVVVREIKKPLSATEDPAATGRPTPGECAEALAELANPRSDQRVSSETRLRLRQCFEKR